MNIHTKPLTNSSAFPADSAGRVMKTNIPTANPSQTLGQVAVTLKQQRFDSINFIYILDNEAKLIGVVSIKDLFEFPESTSCSEVMVTELVKARVHTDQERVALLSLKHNIKAIPIVDKDNKFMGVIDSDTMLQIIDREAVEDILRFAGVVGKGKGYDNVMQMSVTQSLRNRLPWLLIGLLGGMVMAGVISGFEEVLARNIILAAYIPLIVYMAAAVGIQMVALIVRDLTISHDLSFKAYFAKQVPVVLGIGIVISIVLYVISLILHADPQISLVLGISLFFSTISSVIMGMLVPYGFKRLGFDPANASGPIGTMAQDVISVFIYLLVALLIISPAS